MMVRSLLSRCAKPKIDRCLFYVTGQKKFQVLRRRFGGHAFERVGRYANLTGWIAAAIDTHSDHPLAQAVVKYAEERGIDFPQSENYQARTGRGAEAEIAGHHYFVGSRHAMEVRRSRMAKPIPSHSPRWAFTSFVWAARALQKMFVFATRDTIELSQTVAYRAIFSVWCDDP